MSPPIRRRSLPASTSPSQRCSTPTTTSTTTRCISMFSNRRTAGICSFHCNRHCTRDAHIPALYANPNLRKGDAIMQCVETSLMKCPDPTPSNLVHGLLKAMKAGTPCGAAAQGWHTGGSDRFRLGIAAILVTVLRFSL